jgi:hypothetical protein
MLHSSNSIWTRSGPDGMLRGGRTDAGAKIVVAEFGAEHSYLTGPRIGRHGLGFVRLTFSLPHERRVARSLI